MAHRIEVIFTIPDTRAVVRKKELREMDFGAKIDEVYLVDVYIIDKELTNEDLHKTGDCLSNPVVQKFSVDNAIIPGDFDYAVEIGFLPGVTDNIGTTARETIDDLLRKIRNSNIEIRNKSQIQNSKSKTPNKEAIFKEGEAVYSSQITFIKGNINEEEAKKIGEALANPLIQRIQVKSKEQFEKDKGMDAIVPKVHLSSDVKIDEVNLDLNDEELKKLGKAGIPDKDGSRRGPLALNLESLKVIKSYFDKEGRKPTDIELESIAQTWSEHCKHTIFANQMDEIIDGIYKHYIKRATEEIRQAKGKDDICVSVFKDNSGGIIFDKDYLVTDKVETHNSPSALDPFGGAITGIVGVNRDAIGFGLGAKPVANRYGFCFADPNDDEPIFKDKELKNKLLSPKRIMEGVVKGVNAGGNCSGIPTPQGFMYFEERYKGKPLVFVGTVGLIPKKVCGKPGFEKKALNSDKIVMIGGRVGQDGIHGATFSSEALSSGSPATAVQIGDPITQKKLSDAIVKEARDQGLYNSITDNGAGGLSCSIAEMAKESGGCRVDLDKVPLKYPNLEPWKIWISESQERMTLAVPENKLDEFMDLMQRRGVEATVLGEFNDSGRCIVFYKGKKNMDIDMYFLHEGLPPKVLNTTYTKKHHEEPSHIPCPSNLTDTLRDMLSMLNICSHDFVTYQYDHNVQCSAVIQPLQGKGKVNGEASVIRPVLKSKRGVVLSQSLYPAQSDIDTYHMAGNAIDTAIRNAISVGGDLSQLTLLDNFCWCSSNDPERLGQLKESAKACYDFATVFGTPFISGKDSMFNDFKGFDKSGNPIEISVPPTLLISSFGIVNDTNKCITMDAKMPDDLVYVLGKTHQELGASEYYAYLGEKERGKKYIGNSIPKVNALEAKNIYKALQKAIEKELIASAQSVVYGGLGIALAKTAIAGKLGMEIDLKDMPKSADVERDDYALFSESQSRLVVTIAAENKSKFEKTMKGIPFECIGKVTDNGKLVIKGLKKEVVVEEEVEKLEEAYKKTMKGY